MDEIVTNGAAGEERVRVTLVPDPAGTEPRGEGAASDPGPAPGPRSVRSVLVTVARVVAMALVLAAAGYALATNWEDVSRTVREMNPLTTVAATLLVMVGIGCGTMSWQAILEDLGDPVGVRRGGQIFLVGQLGKYVPGSVWAYVLQVELGRRAGLARARVFAASVFSVVVAVVGALVVGALALPELLREEPSLSWLRWLYVLLPVGAVALHPRALTALASFAFRLMRKPQPPHPVRRRKVLASLAWALGSYTCYGAHLWLLVSSTGPASAGYLLLLVGGMGIAMVAGVFAVIVPSGAGVREVVLVTVMAPAVGFGTAVAYAAVSRVLFTVADLVMAGAAAGLAAVARRRDPA